MPQSSFRKDQFYTRPEVAALVGRPENRWKGGDWDTGYSRWNDEFFIFCNVGIPGKTGHDYPNRWDGDELVWTGKTGSRKGTPFVSEMLSGIRPVHLFWRGKLDVPFTYAGLASAVEVTDTIPVEVRWAFDAASPGEDDEINEVPVWRRGPPPSTGTHSIVKYDGPTKLYLLTLEGPANAVLPALEDDLVAVKVGITNHLARRLAQLNFGFPPGSSVKWRVHRTRTYPSGEVAFAAEGEILEGLRLARRWIGGEFAVVRREELDTLLTLPRPA